MSTLNVVRPGLGNAASFQSSGIPWAKTEVIPSGGSSQFSFQLVSKFVSVTNGNNDNSHMLRVAFSELGLDTNYFLVGPGQTVTLEVKVTDLFLAPNSGHNVTASVAAGLTNISTANILNNWSGSAGVG